MASRAKRPEGSAAQSVHPRSFVTAAPGRQWSHLSILTSIVEPGSPAEPAWTPERKRPAFWSPPPSLQNSPELAEPLVPTTPSTRRSVGAQETCTTPTLSLPMTTPHPSPTFLSKRSPFSLLTRKPAPRPQIEGTHKNKHMAVKMKNAHPCCIKRASLCKTLDLWGRRARSFRVAPSIPHLTWGKRLLPHPAAPRSSLPWAQTP